MISEPADFLTTAFVDETTGKTAAFVVGFEDFLEDFLLGAARGDECDLVRVRHDRQCQGDSPCWRLGAVFDRGDPGIRLAQELVAGEQTARVPIRTTAQQDQVEDGRLDRVLAGETRHERLLVLVGQFLRVVEVLDVDGVDGRCALFAGDLIEEVFLQKAVVAVFVVERDGALVGEEDFPFRKLWSGLRVLI